MDMSHGEKGAWASLIALAVACVWYLNAYAGPLVSGSLGFSDLWVGLVGIIILIIIVESIFHGVVASDGARKKTNPSSPTTDERDAFIDARTDRWPSFILGAGCITGIFVAAFQPAIMTAHVLLLALVLAECIKLVAQILCYRRGV